MRALTVLNPWAWAILHGKDVENRGWPVPGWRLDELAIHAGARSGWDDGGEFSPLVQSAWIGYLGPVSAMSRFTGTRNVELYRDSPLITHSAVVAVAEGVSCHHATDCQQDWQPAGCSAWGVSGQFHWSWKVLHVLATPVPCRGYQKLWTVPDDVERAVRAQLEAHHG